MLNVLFTYSFNKEIKTKVTCNCLHPGFVNSNFGNNNDFYFKFLVNFFRKLVAITPKKGSETMIFLAEANRIKNISGKYFYKKKEVRSSSYSYNEKVAKIVWNKTLEYLK